MLCVYFFFFKQKTAYEMRISYWSSDVCSSDLGHRQLIIAHAEFAGMRLQPQQRVVAIIERRRIWRLDPESVVGRDDHAGLRRDQPPTGRDVLLRRDRKSTRLNSSH